MPSTNFKANLRETFSAKHAWLNHGAAVATGLIYPLLPKALGLNGYGALAVGAGVPFAVGALFGIPGATHAALGIASAHLSYIHAAPALFTDGQAWTLGDDNITEVVLPNGERVQVEALPAPDARTAMADYYVGTNDYYTDRQSSLTVSDYYNGSVSDTFNSRM